MATPAPIPPRRPLDLTAWKPGRRTWLWMLGAFAIGLVLFLLAIRGSRDDGFFRAGTVPPSAVPEAYPPLPAPEAEGTGSGIGDMAPAPVEASPPVIEQRPAIPAPRPARPVAATPPRSSTSSKARPIPGQTPPPAYPMRSLARGEGGTTLVLAHIGPDGVPTSVGIAQSSGSRDLDRAATEAVRRWRFQPEMADGNPTVGTVAIPIEFRPGD